MSSSRAQPSAARLSTVTRVALAIGAVALVATAAAVSPKVASPIQRLGNAEADGAEPIWNVPIDAAAIRRAHGVLPERSRYYIHARPGARRGILYHDILGATHLYFPRSFPVRTPADAEWVLSYRAPTLLPRGLRARDVHRLGEGIYLVRVA